MRDDGRDRSTSAAPELTPAERVLRRRSADNPGEGRPLSSRARQAQRTVEGYLKGGNPPRWMERIAEIDNAVQRERRELAAEHRGLRTRWRHDPGEFARRWRALVAERDYRELNELIRQHNEWYPVERNLAVNPRTGEYVAVHGRTHVRPLLGPAWVLEQFPAELPRQPDAAPRRPQPPTEPRPPVDPRR